MFREKLITLGKIKKSQPKRDTKYYVMIRNTARSKILTQLSPHRLLSSQTASSIKVTKSSFSRLEALRQELANEDERISLDDFAGEQSVVVRRKAAPRGAKILPKPKWLKVQPANSENYHRLRKTVRESGLATVW